MIEDKMFGMPIILYHQHDDRGFNHAFGKYIDKTEKLKKAADGLSVGHGDLATFDPEQTKQIASAANLAHTEAHIDHGTSYEPITDLYEIFKSACEGDPEAISIARQVTAEQVNTLFTNEAHARRTVFATNRPLKPWGGDRDHALDYGMEDDKISRIVSLMNRLIESGVIEKLPMQEREPGLLGRLGKRIFG